MSKSVLVNAVTGEVIESEYDDGFVPPTFEERLASARASATLTRRKFFLGLDALGIYDTVMAAELPRSARIELDTATSFERTWPTLVQMAHSMGFTDEQLDALFGIEVTP